LAEARLVLEMKNPTYAERWEMAFGKKSWEETVNNEATGEQLEMSFDDYAQSLTLAYYDKAFIKNLKANMAFSAFDAPKPLPMDTGQTVKFFTYGK
jgi:hypothetical protein